MFHIFCWLDSIVCGKHTDYITSNGELITFIPSPHECCPQTIPIRPVPRNQINRIINYEKLLKIDRSLKIHNCQSTNKCISDGLMHVAAWHCQTRESTFTKFMEEMSTGQTPNHSKFCGNSTRCLRYPLSKICAPLKSGPNFTKIFQGMLPTKAPNQPKFCHNWLKNMGDICNQKFVLTENVGQN